MKSDTLEETKDRKAVETDLWGPCFALPWVFLDSCAPKFCQSLLACLFSLRVAAGADLTFKTFQKGVELESVFIQVQVSGGTRRCGQELGLPHLSWSA